jgi:hypothetical protein
MGPLQTLQPGAKLRNFPIPCLDSRIYFFGPGIHPVCPPATGLQQCSVALKSCGLRIESRRDLRESSAYFTLQALLHIRHIRDESLEVAHTLR